MSGLRALHLLDSPEFDARDVMLGGLGSLAMYDQLADDTMIEIDATDVQAAVAMLQALRPAQLQLLAKASDYQVRASRPACSHALSLELGCGPSVCDGNPRCGFSDPLPYLLPFVPCDCPPPPPPTPQPVMEWLISQRFFELGNISNTIELMTRKQQAQGFKHDVVIALSMSLDYLRVFYRARSLTEIVDRTTRLHINTVADLSCLATVVTNLRLIQDLFDDNATKSLVDLVKQVGVMLDSGRVTFSQAQGQLKQFEVRYDEHNVGKPGTTPKVLPMSKVHDLRQAVIFLRKRQAPTATTTGAAAGTSAGAGSSGASSGARAGAGAGSGAAAAAGVSAGTPSDDDTINRFAEAVSTLEDLLAVLQLMPSGVSVCNVPQDLSLGDIGAIRDHVQRCHRELDSWHAGCRTVRERHRWLTTLTLAQLISLSRSLQSCKEFLATNDGTPLPAGRASQLRGFLRAVGLDMPQDRPLLIDAFNQAPGAPPFFSSDVGFTHGSMEEVGKWIKRFEPRSPPQRGDCTCLLRHSDTELPGAYGVALEGGGGSVAEERVLGVLFSSHPPHVSQVRWQVCMRIRCVVCGSLVLLVCAVHDRSHWRKQSHCPSTFHLTPSMAPLSPCRVQVLRCDEDTSPEELELFLERVVVFPTSRFVLVSPTKLPYQLSNTLHAFLMSGFVDLRRLLDDGLGAGNRPGSHKWNLVLLFTDALDGTSSLRRLCKDLNLPTAGLGASVVYRSRFPALRLQAYMGGDGVGKSFALLNSMRSDTAAGRLVLSVRVSEPFSADIAVDALAGVAAGGAGAAGDAAIGPTFAEAVAAGTPVTLVFFVSAYAPLVHFDTFLFDLCVLGVVTSRTSGVVLALPSNVDLRVAVEVPSPTSPIPDHAGQGPTQVQVARGVNVLREGTAREVRQRPALGAAPKRARAALACPCETCVAAVPGYVPGRGCLHILRTLCCVAVEEVAVDDHVPFVLPSQLAEGDAKRGFLLAFRVLKGYFTPLPDMWEDHRGYTVRARGRVLADVTLDLHDRPPGLVFHTTQATSDSASDVGLSDELTFDEPVLDGLMSDADVVALLQDKLQHRDDLADIFTNKRQLTFFLSHVARAIDYWERTYYRRFNMTEL